MVDVVLWGINPINGVAKIGARFCVKFYCHVDLCHCQLPCAVDIKIILMVSSSRSICDTQKTVLADGKKALVWPSLMCLDMVVWFMPTDALSDGARFF